MYQSDPYRSSDHDPVIIELFPAQSDPYSLSNSEVDGPYNSCNTVYVTWDITGSTGAPNYINVEYVLADGTSLEVVSYPFSPTVESDNKHSIVEGVETGQFTEVWIYFAVNATDRHGDSSISNPKSTTYYSYIKGDVSDDNEIHINDAIMYLRYVVGLPPNNVNPIDDLTCDNEIHINDALLVLRKSVGYDENFCCDFD